MNLDKITKGKCEVNEITPAKGISYPCVMINPHGTIVASCSNGTREETEANAQLISAAPELLEALITAQATLRQLNINAVCDNTILLVTNAIKKATE